MGRCSRWLLPGWFGTIWFYLPQVTKSAPTVFCVVTGEEEPVSKKTGERLLSGSFVVAGSATAQLTQVGSEAFANGLAREAKKDPRVKKSEMMAALDRLIRVMGIILVPVGGILFCHEYFALGRPLRVGVESMTAALVGMIPEGLYLLTSIALAVSSMLLARRQVLVRDMQCIESLARVDVLCLDKTGTITEPALEVEQVIPLVGDPTALLNAMAVSLPPENETAKAIGRAFSGTSDWRCEQYIPFTAQTRWTGWDFAEKGRFYLGAPEAIPGVDYEKVRGFIEPYTVRGLRTLMAADGEGTPLALVLLASRIRPDAIKTFTYFKNQGVTIKVISGDDPRTVSAIAQRAGIENSENWVDASALNTDEAIAAATGYTVFGRVNPAQKRSLIRALKAQGHTVAMTGDGVNDILAMKDADCAVAMAGGAQAASQVAQLVLLKGDFSAMPQIVNEGRRVIHNIQRAAALFLVKNIFSLGITLLTLLTGQPYPMEPQHMTIISGLTIGFPAFFLALEPNVQPVRGRFLPAVLKKALPGGVTDVLVVLLLQSLLPLLQLSSREISTLATVALATTGLLVLRRTAKPFTRLRALVWCAAAVGLVGCFTLLGGIFEFAFSAVSLTLVPVVVLVTAGVFWLLEKYFIANF